MKQCRETTSIVYYIAPYIENPCIINTIVRIFNEFYESTCTSPLSFLIRCCYPNSAPLAAAFLVLLNETTSKQ